MSEAPPDLPPDPNDPVPIPETVGQDQVADDVQARLSHDARADLQRSGGEV